MMEQNNNKFSWSRFWTLLKRHFADGRKNNQIMLLAVFVLSMILLLVFTMMPQLMPEDIDNPLMKNFNKDMLAAIMASSNTGTVVSIFSYVFLSLVCSNMSNRSGDIAYLMLPATNLEKWLSRVIYVVVVGLVLIYGVYYLAVFLCTGIGHLFNVASLKLLGSMSFDISSTNMLLGMDISPTTINILLLLGYCMSFFMIAMFIWGGTYFRRLGWLYTALILMAIGFVSVFVLGFSFAFLNLDEMVAVARSTGEEGPSAMLSIFDGLFFWSSIVLIVLGILVIWLSYKVFCRRQIESHRIRVIK